MKLKDVQDGQTVLVLDGDFKGELFFRNVMGIHSITGNRYWPSEYADRQSRGSNHNGPLASCHHSYRGPLDVEVQPVVLVVPKYC